jgi:hypothetical protein
MADTDDRFLPSMPECPILAVPGTVFRLMDAE